MTDRRGRRPRPLTRHKRRAVFLGAVGALLFVAALTPPGRAVAIGTRSGRLSAERATVYVKGNKLFNRSGNAIRLLGVDVAGTESACVHSSRVSFAPISKHEAKKIAKWGANAVRVPLNEDCWLGINGLPRDYSSAHYRVAIRRWVSDLNSAGLLAILDLHWSAPGNIPATRQWPMADETHAVTFWRKVAQTFKSDPAVIFDLFNEPALGGRHPTQADWTCWQHGCVTKAVVCSRPKRQGVCSPHTFAVAGMQQLLDTVRGAGAKQPAMVGGLVWAGDPCGVNDAGPPGGCMWLEHRPSDPEHQMIASFHTYDTSACKRVACWNASVTPVAEALPVVTGELGEKACSDAYVTSYMSWADTHGLSYLVWSWQPGRIGETCAQQGTRLITSWAGGTNSANPTAHAVQAHLRKELRRQGSTF